jgi:catechol 2,3-dioxygenase-like lactoylglutathione lyase family enzyme
MIADVSIGVRDIERSKSFYDAALEEPLGHECITWQVRKNWTSLCEHPSRRPFGPPQDEVSD